MSSNIDFAPVGLARGQETPGSVKGTLSLADERVFAEASFFSNKDEKNLFAEHREVYMERIQEEVTQGTEPKTVSEGHLRTEGQRLSEGRRESSLFNYEKGVLLRNSWSHRCEYDFIVPQEEEPEKGGFCGAGRSSCTLF
eukprot:TRINITY_DN1425_c0_g4_i2.p1 TRINITY_DN1425_c0_g4~~TRINITY_DN1425_c0_g4_i2.p1  ORF type:complete len:140 (+),score=21.42 TRINITY_DN1425_c0_g4_i2:136-555(+)